MHPRIEFFKERPFTLVMITLFAMSILGGMIITFILCGVLVSLFFILVGWDNTQFNFWERWLLTFIVCIVTGLLASIVWFFANGMVTNSILIFTLFSTLVGSALAIVAISLLRDMRLALQSNEVFRRCITFIAKPTFLSGLAYVSTSCLLVCFVISLFLVFHCINGCGIEGFFLFYSVPGSLISLVVALFAFWKRKHSLLKK